jgi:hypothetical protein
VSNTKKTPQVLNAHAKQRAEERYGLNLNKDARHEIVQMIQTNQAEFVGKESNSRTLWRVNYQEQSLNVVYDKARSTLCTVLPKEAIEFQPGGFEHHEPQFEGKASGQTRAAITAELADLWKDTE